MSVAADVRKVADEIADSYRDYLTVAAHPFYAAVGYADYAVEQARELPAWYANELKKLQGYLTELPGRATTRYDEFVGRGEELFGSVRRQPSTQRAKQQAKNTRRSTKATRTSARKTASAAGRAADDAAHKVG